jgi:ABC-type multidrug transport system fused ATPase/permease subunit
MAMISIFNLLGSIAISFAFGWKLSLVGILAIMPVVLSAGYLRVSLERGFEKLNSAGKLRTQHLDEVSSEGFLPTQNVTI